MYRIALILFGIILLILNQTGQLISFNLQFSFFIAGIILLGIPHGAADLLVAIQNRQHQKSVFSRILVKLIYTFLKLIIFGVNYWL